MITPLQISFCTTCKGRLDQLQQTLPVNLERARGYANAEFVVLAYGDPETAHWVRNHFPDEIAAGLVRCFETDAEYFRMAHAKNMAHRLSTGDVLVNVDADNFIPEGFPQWLNRHYQADPDLVLQPSFRGRALHNKLGYPARGNCGMISLSRGWFDALGGYAEAHEGWGKEDTQFVGRARAAGARVRPLPLHKLGRYLTHSHERRTAYMAPEQVSSWRRPKRTLSLTLRYYLRVLLAWQGTDCDLEHRNERGAYGCGQVSEYLSDGTIRSVTLSTRLQKMRPARDFVATAQHKSAPRSRRGALTVHPAAPSPDVVRSPDLSSAS